MHERNFQSVKPSQKKGPLSLLPHTFVGIDQSRLVLSFSKSNKCRVVQDSSVGSCHKLGANSPPFL